jgi:hypothetical protein
VAKWLTIQMEALLSFKEVQKKGVIMLADMSQMGWKNFDPALEKLWLDTLQKKLPLSMKRMVMYRPGWIISLMMKIVMPWMSKKLRERMVQTHEEESLFEILPKSSLPEEFGGDLKVDFKKDKNDVLRRWIDSRKK